MASVNKIVFNRPDKNCESGLLNTIYFIGKDATSFWCLSHLLLVGIPQQIVHRLDRIERGKRNFHKNGVPVAHRAIPKPR